MLLQLYCSCVLLHEPVSIRLTLFSAKADIVSAVSLMMPLTALS